MLQSLHQALGSATRLFCFALFLSGVVGFIIGIMPLGLAIEQCGLQIMEAAPENAVSIRSAASHNAAEMEGRPFVMLFLLQHFWSHMATYGSPALVLYFISSRDEILLWAGISLACGLSAQAAIFGLHMHGSVDAVRDWCLFLAPGVIWLTWAVASLQLTFSNSFLMKSRVAMSVLSLLLAVFMSLLPQLYSSSKSQILRTLCIVLLPELADAVFEHASFSLLQARGMMKPGNVLFAFCMSIPKAFCAAMATPLILSAESVEIVAIWELLEMILEMRRVVILISGETRVQNTYRLATRLKEHIFPRSCPGQSSQVAPLDVQKSLPEPTVLGQSTRTFDGVIFNSADDSMLRPSSSDGSPNSVGIPDSEKAKEEAEEQTGISGPSSCMESRLSLTLSPKNTEIAACMAPVIVYANYIEISSSMIALSLLVVLDTRTEQTMQFHVQCMLVVVRCGLELISDFVAFVIVQRSLSYEAGGRQIYRLDFRVAAALSAVILAFVLHAQTQFVLELCPRSRSDQQLMTPLVSFGPCNAVV